MRRPFGSSATFKLAVDYFQLLAVVMSASNFDFGDWPASQQLLHDRIQQITGFMSADFNSLLVSAPVAIPMSFLAPHRRVTPLAPHRRVTPLGSGWCLEVTFATPLPWFCVWSLTGREHAERATEHSQRNV